jgi:hypothetical protein
MLEAIDELEGIMHCRACGHGLLVREALAAGIIDECDVDRACHLAGDRP